MSYKSCEHTGEPIPYCPCSDCEQFRAQLCSEEPPEVPGMNLNIVSADKVYISNSDCPLHGSIEAVTKFSGEPVTLVVDMKDGDAALYFEITRRRPARALASVLRAAADEIARRIPALAPWPEPPEEPDGSQENT